jgi:catechol 2,3-dioxygenase-like lactoylglutathione lyase family enzyme
MMPANGIFYIEAFVSDLAQSKQFYGEVLGWKINTDLPHVAGFHFGSGYLVLLADNRAAASRLYAGGMHVEVHVEDVVAERQRLQDYGIVVGELETKPWGEKKFFFNDPDGYKWSYGQPT